MTVQKDVTKNIYVGNGSTRTFPFTFECPAEHPEYIKVYLMQDDGTALATSDYQLDMDARQITYPSSGTALPEGKKLVIMRELPLQQMMNLVNNGPYFAEDVETAFDENVMAMQQIAEKLNRSIIMSVDIDGDAFVNEVPFEAGKSFRIADDGKSIVLTEDPARVLPLAQEAYAQAQAQAQSASASASAAAKSEDSAAASASEAGNSAQSASTSAAGAAESARLAEGYKNVAETAKSDASLYADNAKTSADNATASKKVAQSAANSASNFATDARSSVSEAKSYRDAASTYATNAKNYSENVNVFVPSVSSDGILSWTNKAGLPNPPSVNIKGKDGADGGVTVDDTLSDTSTNAIQNKVVKAALDNRAVLDESNTFTSPNSFDDIYMADGMSSLKWYNGSHNFVVASINSKKYTGEAATAKKATQDGDGNVITSTYATKTELNSCVKSVNNVTPDSNGNVNISVSGGGSGVTVDEELSSTSTNPVQNKTIYNALLNKAGTDIFSGFDLNSPSATIRWRSGSQNYGILTASNYSGTALRATQDGAGNVITDTYTKKADFDKIISDLDVAFQQKADKSDLADVATSGKYTDLLNRPTYVVQSVNNIKPDSNGNVSISVEGGGGSDITVDAELSDTSTNPVQNKVVKAALDNRAVLDDVNTFTSPNNFDDIYMEDGINSLKWYNGSPNFVVASITSKRYTGEAATAKKATQDGDGNVITSTYATKTELNSCVKSVNNVTPDENGNVTISVSGGGIGGSITIDSALSSTSTNPVQNKVIKDALDDKANLNKNNTFLKENWFEKGVSLLAYRDSNSAIKWYQSPTNPSIASIDATNYTGTAAKATQDGAGNVITETYATKSDISGVVKSVNGTKPDSNGNVTITVSGGSNVTVDTTLSATSTNPIANKTVYSALGGKLGKTETAYAATKATQDGAGNVIATTYIKTVNNVKPDSNGNVNISGGTGGNITVDSVLSPTSTNAIQNKVVQQEFTSVRAAIPTKVSQLTNDSGYLTQHQSLDGYVKTVNNTAPDSNGNVTIALSGGGGVSTSESNTWTGKQTFQKMKFNFESYNAPRISGATDNPAASVAVYNVQGNFTLDMSVLAGLLNNGDATLFTAYITTNGAYTLSITNAGTLKYVGNASDLAITVNGLLLNILLIKSSSGVLSSVAQASTLS